MLKRLSIAVFFIFISYGHLFAATPDFKPDTLVRILKLTDKAAKEKKLTSYLLFYFKGAPATQLDSSKTVIDSLLTAYNISNREAYNYYVDCLYEERLGHLDDAERNAVKGVYTVNKTTDDYLTFVFLKHLAIVQNEKGNTIEAIYNYWRAKKEVVKLNDYHAQASLDINISDIYYKNGAYNQSLFYLDQAYKLIRDNHLNEKHFLTLIYYNKAETFFRIKDLDSLKIKYLDSLKLYTQKLKDTSNVSYKIFTYRKRTDYYVEFLSHHYKNAIQLINAMISDKKYVYSELDKEHLADAYYLNGQADSAKAIVNQLLQGPLESNNPEIKFHLYDMLASIAERNGDGKAALANYKLAVEQSKLSIDKLTEINNASSQIKIDELEGSYMQTTQSLTEMVKNEKLILLFTSIVAALFIIMIFMFYRNIRQKRKYDNLLHQAERHELAFLNSHDVRKHLCNVLGVINLIKESDEPEAEFLESQEFLYYSAKEMDASIKNIADKLND